MKKLVSIKYVPNKPQYPGSNPKPYDEYGGSYTILIIQPGNHNDWIVLEQRNYHSKLRALEEAKSLAMFYSTELYCDHTPEKYTVSQFMAMRLSGKISPSYSYPGGPA